MNFQAILVVLAGGALLAGAQAQGLPGNADPAPLDGAAWQDCTRLADDPAARLVCFDRWARQQAPPVPPPHAGTPPPAAPAPAPAAAPEPSTATARPDCRSGPQSALSHFWELEAGSDCGRFNIRGYRPLSLSVVGSDSVNAAPSSPTAGHTADYQPYLPTEGRIQLSVRTKIAQGFLPRNAPERRDSLWFGYSQQSYWQIFTSSISRPFRNTDHEPEFMYIVPTDAELPGGWRLRYSGVSINHQSNGQSLPLSRSWNRVILMAGMEKGERFTLTGRLWQRISDGDETDDNPGISDFVGRAEVSGMWKLSKNHTLGLTVRHSLRVAGNGSIRIDWLRAIGNSGRGSLASGLRFHTQLFSGYGDSLLDYNRPRTVLSVGLSLVDW